MLRTQHTIKGTCAAIVFMALFFAMTMYSQTVDDLIATCPPAAEIDAINSKLQLIFDADPTAGTLVCTAANGSADLTRLQERTYQALRVMQHMSFDVPLPWTPKPLYDWFVDAISGIRFRSDIQASFCCDPAGIINIQTNNLAALQTTRWIDPSLGTGLDGFPMVWVHEARHNEGFPHTCGADNDQSISELGGWGVAYYLEEWEAFHSGSFLAPTLPAPSLSYYQDAAWFDAQTFRDIRICSHPPILLSPTTIDFGTQLLNTSSAPRTVAVTAGTSTPVTVFNIGISGNAAEFILTNTACGNAVVPPSCAAVVTFGPTTEGAKSATLVVQHSASSTSLSASLTGAGVLPQPPDFMLGATPQTAVVSRGQSAIYNVTVTPQSGSFNNAITLSCSGLPSLSSCTFSPNPITPGANPAKATMTVSTTSTSAALRKLHRMYAACFLALGLALPCALPGVNKRRRVALGVIFLLFVALLSFAGCGGASSGSPPVPTVPTVPTVPKPSTPTGSFTVTVTAVSGPVQHSTQVTLVVQ